MLYGGLHQQAFSKCITEGPRSHSSFDITMFLNEVPVCIYHLSYSGGIGEIDYICLGQIAVDGFKCPAVCWVLKEKAEAENF